MSTMKIKELYTYPIKSLRGCSLASIPATYQGFAHDRRFMLLIAKDLTNMHVAKYTEMCLFTTEIVFPGHTSSDVGKIIVTFNPPSPNDFSPQHTRPSSIDVPLSPSTETLKEVPVSMHSSPTIGFHMGKVYEDWFTERFGYGVILVYIGNNRREILGNMPPNVAIRQQRQSAEPVQNGGKGWMASITAALPSVLVGKIGEESYPGVDEGIGFADCAPYLVISTKSWEDAQGRLPEGVRMDISKFRPNIIVEGAETAFEEDYWAELELGEAATVDKENQAGREKMARAGRLVLTQNCARCNSLNIDYSTGKVAKGESGTMLKKLQRDRRVDQGAKYSPIFGRYGFLDRVDGGEGMEFRVGDEVRVVRKNRDRSKFEWPNLSTN